MPFGSIDPPREEVNSSQDQSRSVCRGSVDTRARTRDNLPGRFTIFSHDMHEVGPSRVIPLEVCGKLVGPVSAERGLSLSVNFVRIRRGEPIATHANATSELYYVVRGLGRTRAGGATVNWQTGDLLTLPAGDSSVHAADEESVLFWVHDEPLLNALEARPERSKWHPKVFRADEWLAARATVESTDSRPAQWSPLCVLTASLMHDSSANGAGTLQTMFDVLPSGQARPPQQIRSVTLNLILGCRPGCYTLIGKVVDDGGRIIEPKRVDWEPGSVIAHSPGSWLAHVNESDSASRLMPVRVADLQTSLRTLVLDPGFRGSLCTPDFEARAGR